MTAFSSNGIPWDLRGRWTYCKNMLLSIRISHIFRIGNFGADKVAKFGLTLGEG